MNLSFDRFLFRQFRLRNSGVKNVIYLIEKYGSNQHLSIAEDTLNQAIINTQVTIYNGTGNRIDKMEATSPMSQIYNQFQKILLT